MLVYTDANKTMMSVLADTVKRILSSVSVYGTIVCMPRGTQNTEGIDRAIALILKERAEFLGKSERALALETSVSRWRVNDIFTMKRPILVNELEELADALGLVGSSVMREAERSLEEQADEHSKPAEVIDFPRAQEENLPDFTKLAARKVTNRPEWEARRALDDIGEENQDPVDY